MIVAHFCLLDQPASFRLDEPGNFAVSVVVAGWHFISDMIRAAFVVGFWVCLALAGLRIIGRREREEPGGGRPESEGSGLTEPSVQT